MFSNFNSYVFFSPRNFALDPQKPSPSGMGLGGILDHEVPSYEYRDMMWGPQTLCLLVEITPVTSSLFAYHKPYWRYVHQLRTFAHLCHGTGPDHGWQRAASCFWSEKKSHVIGTNWGFRPSRASSAFPRDMLAPLCRFSLGFVISHTLCALCAALLPFHFSQVSWHCAWATAAVCEIVGDA